MNLRAVNNETMNKLINEQACYCGVLTLAGHQLPTKVTLSLPSESGQGRKNVTKHSWVLDKILSKRSLTSTVSAKQTQNGTRIMRSKSRS